jgi:hypothetical protein
MIMARRCCVCSQTYGHLSLEDEALGNKDAPRDAGDTRRRRRRRRMNGRFQRREKGCAMCEANSLEGQQITHLQLNHVAAYTVCS